MEQVLWIVVLLSSAVAATLSVDVENLDDLGQALVSVARHEDEGSAYQINIKVHTLSRKQNRNSCYDLNSTLLCFKLNVWPTRKEEKSVYEFERPSE